MAHNFGDWIVELLQTNPAAVSQVPGYISEHFSEERVKGSHTARIRTNVIEAFRNSELPVDLRNRLLEIVAGSK